MRSLILLAALVSGCTCNKTITEKAPDDLAIRGIVIDQPAENTKLTGAWVTVAGWVAPEGVESLAAIGAPVCWVDTQYDARLQELGVKLTGRFRDGYALTTDSRLVAWEDTGLGIRLQKTRGKVVDVAAGPTEFNVDFATVNTEGAIEVYRTARHDATWVLPYKATAIGSDVTGRLYVGGPGVVELRDFEALR